MIVLDTNVVSELMHLSPDEAVQRWIAAQSPDDLYISSITVAELLTGVLLLPQGRRRDMIETRVRHVIEQFGPVVLAFGKEAAEIYAALAARAPLLDAFDGQVAAIAHAHGAAVATRNIKHFLPLGIELVDPWAG